MKKKTSKPALDAHDQLLYDRIIKILRQDDEKYKLKNFSSSEMVEIAIFKGEQEAGIGFDRNQKAHRIGIVTPVYRTSVTHGIEREHFSHTLEADLDSNAPDFDTQLALTLRSQIAEAARAKSNSR